MGPLPPQTYGSPIWASAVLMAAAARTSGASVVNSAWRSWAPGTGATTPPAPGCGAAVSVAVGEGAGPIVGRIRQYRGRADRICRGQQGEGVEADGPGGGPGGVRGVGDRDGLRDGDRRGTHRRAEPGDDQDRGECPSRDRGTADPDDPAPGSTGVVGTASLDAPALIVVGHLSGSPR